MTMMRAASRLHRIKSAHAKQPVQRSEVNAARRQVCSCRPAGEWLKPAVPAEAAADARHGSVEDSQGIVRLGKERHCVSERRLARMTQIV